MPSRNAKPRPRGTLVEIAPGRRLHAVFAGPAAAQPLVLLEAGAFGFSADWAAVQGALADIGLRSVAYDRAGLGFSDEGPSPRDGLAIAADRDSLLAAMGETGPFIFCGHSMAGLHARLFAAGHRDATLGVVLVDATTPEAMESRLVSGLVDQFARASKLAAWGAGVGLLKPLSETGLGDAIGLAGPASGEKRWAFAHGAHNQWAAAEVEAWPQTAEQARAAGPFDPELPVAVVLAGAASANSPVRAFQTTPADDSTRGRVEYVTGANHASLLSPTYADAIVRAVQYVRGRSADGASVSPATA
ncbi:MAG TPA: alpha/beta hydrolase [Caulobacteraceae bacterium]|jgi:pimeloyl-ACP methyl ester carboxylesterase|nr:alpha/beta hydrolase [Caulobacteraceae bacterium]